MFVLDHRSSVANLENYKFFYLLKSFLLNNVDTLNNIRDEQIVKSKITNDAFIYILKIKKKLDKCTRIISHQGVKFRHAT